MTLSSSSYIVTGAASGIGRSAVIQLAERGANVAAVDIDVAGARSTAAEATRAGNGAAIAIDCDVSIEEEVETAVQRTVAEFGPLRGVFANAGVDLGGLLHELPIETWRRVVRVNLTGTFLTCKHSLRSMLANRTPGAIVCTSSPAAEVAFAAGGMGAYAASKGGISALVRSTAVDYARHGIRINAIVPGPTETSLMWASTPTESRDALRSVIRGEVPLGRLADPGEIARAALWLLSDEASYVTGASLHCDGGVLAKASISV